MSLHEAYEEYVLFNYEDENSPEKHPVNIAVIWMNKLRGCYFFPIADRRYKLWIRKIAEVQKEDTASRVNVW